MILCICELDTVQVEYCELDSWTLYKCTGRYLHPVDSGRIISIQWGYP